jgi:hypothetical protein
MTESLFNHGESHKYKAALKNMEQACEGAHNKTLLEGT